MRETCICGTAHAVGDLALEQTFSEAQPEHETSARIKHAGELVDHRSRLDVRVTGIRRPKLLQTSRRRALLVGERSVERVRILSSAGLEPVEHLLVAAPERDRNLPLGGGPAELLPQAITGLRHLLGQFLGSARWPDRPRAVAEAAP